MLAGETTPGTPVAVQERMAQGLPQRLEVMALKLLGRCRDGSAVDVLLKRAVDERHYAAAAIAALGQLAAVGLLVH